MSTCSKCQQSILNNAQFCHNCGLASGMTSETAGAFNKHFIINFREIPAIQPQIETHFNEYLNQKTKEEFGTEAMCDYLAIFKKSDYPEEITEMSATLAEQVYTIHCRQDAFVQSNIDELLLQTFSSIVDEFFLSYCYNDEVMSEHLKETVPSSADAQQASAPQTSTAQTSTAPPIHEIDAAYLPLPTNDQVLDEPSDQGQSTNQYPVIRDVDTFFDVENSPYKIYNDLNKIPTRILDEVKKNFLFNAPEERVLLIYDDTVFGSGSTGFALTEHAVYWKTHFQTAHRTYYQEVMDIEMDGSKLLINDELFDIDASVNYKVYEWLRGKAL